MVLGLSTLVLFPAVQRPRETGNAPSCLHHLKYLALAIHNYHEIHGELPPALGVRNETTPEHSWRARVMYLLEGSHYFTYDPRQSWDAPANMQGAMPLPSSEMQCPDHGTGTDTNYFAIVGTQTAWGDGAPLKISSITDGTSNTILIVEAAGRGIHWAEPRDLSFDEAVILLATPLDEHSDDGHRVEEGYFYKPSYRRNVAFCDGHVESLRMPLAREAAIALLTANGGETVDPEWLESGARPQLDFGRIWAFSAFVVLALLPGIRPLRPWIWPIARHPPSLVEMNRVTAEPVQ